MYLCCQFFLVKYGRIIKIRFLTFKRKMKFDELLKYSTKNRIIKLWIKNRTKKKGSKDLNNKISILKCFRLFDFLFKCPVFGTNRTRSLLRKLNFIYIYSKTSYYFLHKSYLLAPMSCVCVHGFCVWRYQRTKPNCQTWWPDIWPSHIWQPETQWREWSKLPLRQSRI